MFGYIFIIFISFFLIVSGCNNSTNSSKSNIEEKKQANKKIVTPIKVTSSYIAKRIEDGEPMDVQNSFELKNPDERIEVYYWIEGVTTEIPIEVWHVWKKNGKEMVRFRVPITDYHFKEWSSIDITADDVGKWEVKTIYKNEPLDTETFTVTYQGKIISIVDKTFTTAVKNRNPVNRIHKIEFEPRKKICFWTKVKTDKPTTIYHVWYHNGKPFFIYDLEIKQPSFGWRTWSCITMGKIPTYNYTGTWKVVVENAEGKPITEDYLEILPKKQEE